MIKMLARAVISCESSTGEGSTFKLIYMVVIRMQFLKGYWTKGFTFLLAAGHRLPSVPCHIGLLWHLVSSEQAREKSQRECQKERKRE